MKIIDVDLIMKFVLIIWALFFTIAPTYLFLARRKTIHKIYAGDDKELFFDTIDKYLRKDLGKKEKEMFKLEKLIGMLKYKDWREPEKLIASIFPFYNKLYMPAYCNVTINLYMLGRIEEANGLAIKIENPKNKYKNDMAVKLCIAIKHYFDNEIQKSKICLEDLLKSDISNEFAKANIYYYLGLISLDENDIDKCKNYLENVILFKQKCAIKDKSQEILSSL